MCRNIEVVDDPLAPSGAPGGAAHETSVQYYHGEQIGTTRFMTDSNGQQMDPAVYTAFGELRPNSTTHRYGYAGAWGYQTHEDFPFLHVGARYYDPSTGRFLQRDPIGIAGGLNVYAYVRNGPTIRIDPDGLVFESVDEPNDPNAPPSGFRPPKPPKPRPKPPTPLSPQEELRRIRRNKRAWDLVFGGLCIAAWATPGAQPIAIGIGIGLLGREGADLVFEL